MPRTRVVISQDYDGCYSIVTPIGLNAELTQSHNIEFYSNPIYAHIVQSLSEMSDVYGAYLTEITQKADAVSVYVGSDRQSFILDKLNRDKHSNGSVFSALQELCEARSTVERPWTFEPFLLSDGEKRGSALEKMSSIPGESDLEFNQRQLVTPKPTRFIDKERRKPSKIPLLIAQMQDARREYPDDEIEFHFVDDRQDLLKDIQDNLELTDIPSRLTLHISKFDYIGVVRKEPGSFGLVKTFNREPAPHLSHQRFFSISTELSAAAAAASDSARSIEPTGSDRATDDGKSP